MTVISMTTSSPPADPFAHYDPDTDVERHHARATGRRIRRWVWPGDAVLELGLPDAVVDGLDALTDTIPGHCALNSLIFVTAEEAVA